MKNSFRFFLVMVVFAAMPLAGAGYGQENAGPSEILESVEVNWWQVPLFAVDKKGNPVTDLEEKDIEVWMNHRRIEGFAFFPRVFTLTRAKETGPGSDRPAGVQREIASPPVLKENAVFLLFDLTISADTCARRAVEIAKNIISGAEPGTRFILLTIEPFKGLDYICGPTNDQKELLGKIEEKIIRKSVNRLVSPEVFFDIQRENKVTRTGARDGSQRRVTENEMKLFKELTATYFLRKTDSFFNSFKTLYLVFNSIADNKFVYFFTEGISRSQEADLIGGQSLYRYHLKKSAQYLGRSGAVLFIINPMGVHDASDLITEKKDANSREVGTPTSYITRENTLSGEEWLRIMAKESGGKYLEGKNQQIVETLEQMHQAYYEVSFPDLPGFKGTTREITIKSRRDNVYIHSLRSLEKTRSYSRLSKIEREMVVLNLVAYHNPLVKAGISFQHARVAKIKKNKNRQVYHVILAPEFINRDLDLYKIWVKDGLEVTRIETRTLKATKSKIKIPFEYGDQQPPGLKPYFVLVDGQAGAALVRVIGDEWVDPEEPREQGKHVKKETLPPDQLQKILNGAADYCEKLKQSAFHFFCTEKIVETLDSLVYNDRMLPDIGAQIQDGRYTFQRLPLVNEYSKVKTAVNTYAFSYRLLKSGVQIKEEREWLSSQDSVPVTRDQVVKPTSFFSQRAIFAPLTLLGRERQEYYHFRYLGRDQCSGRSAAVVKVIPKNREQENSDSIFGKVWIDLEDYSTLKIEADPMSIRGYRALKELEKQLNTRLFLTLEIDFSEIRDGIRFPTAVTMMEKYKGGRLISQYKGPKGWERNRTVFTYSDYQFFAVNVEVSIKE